MKATVTHEFEGCFYGCPYCTDHGVMSPESCLHPSLPKPKRIIGYSNKSCEIPQGKDYPDWCPIYHKEQEENFLVKIGYYLKRVI